MSNDLVRIQSGDGSKFNSSLADLERMHNLLVLANEASITNNMTLWLNTLHALDREISPYLNEKENAELDELRLYDIFADRTAQPIMKRRLSRYERELRMFRSKKKLGIVAEDDASTAPLR